MFFFSSRTPLEGLTCFQLQLFHRSVYNADTIFNNDLQEGTVANRNEVIQLRNIHRIEKQIEAETVCLDLDDGISTLCWVHNLQRKGQLLGFKSRSDPPPPGSGLDQDVFVCMIQTNWQRSMFAKYGQGILCIDATHNTTMYENMNLTTLVVRDRWGHGAFSSIRDSITVLTACRHPGVLAPGI
jgi:hypothetical protein